MFAMMRFAALVLIFAMPQAFASSAKSASSVKPTVNASPVTANKSSSVQVNSQMVSAIFNSNEKEVKALKAKGVSLDSVDSEGFTGLMKLSEQGDKSSVEKFLKLGASPNTKTKAGENAAWLATYSGHEDIALILISKGAETGAIHADTKDCLLHAAVRAQAKKLVTKLASTNPECLSLKNDEGKTPAQLAQDIGDKEIAALLAPASRQKQKK